MRKGYFGCWRRTSADLRNTETVSKKAQNSSPVFGGSHLTELSGSLAQELPVAATLKLASEDRARCVYIHRSGPTFVAYTIV